MSDTNVNIGEALIHISANRTLIAKKLTAGEVVKPEVVHGLQTLDQVFEYYKPVLNFRFEDADGFTKSEELRFKTVEDFGLNNITRQSNFLNRQNTKKQIYLKLARQLKLSQSLKDMLADANKRKAFGTILKTMMDDLKKIK